MVINPGVTLVDYAKILVEEILEMDEYEIS